MHHCPGCGAQLAYNARYPWHFCSECLNLAEDREGRTLKFGNVSASGGLHWHYADEDHASGETCSAVGCLIRGREVLVTEARFGGVVAQPVNREVLSDKLRKRGTNLTRK